MINGQLKVWLPAVRANSGADVYTQRLATALERHGVLAEISWFPLRYEFAPFLLKNVSPPAGTDIVIANSWNAFAFKRTGLPLIVIEHHCVFDPAFSPFQSTAQNLYHRFLIKPYAMRSFRAADAIVAVSEFTARSLQWNAGLENVQVIYNWIDTDVFCPTTEDRPIGRPFRLLYVGNPSRRKGGDLLAPIMRKLGAGFELRFTAGLKTENRDSDQFNMVRLGKLSNEELVRAYQECDALIFPTRFEGFGYAALEAMACGKPVIASNNTALPELVQDGVTGILCNTGDVDAFANACRLLVVNSALCSSMGNAGRQRAEERFSEARLIENYVCLIQQLLMPAKVFL
jgi:glycosyltransferase involved in cell wall biosynthesis